MADYDYTFGGVRVRIHVTPHVPHPGAEPRPFLATACAGDALEPVTEEGRPVARLRNAEEQALEAMCVYLETRFGVRRRLSPRPRYGP